MANVTGWEHLMNGEIIRSAYTMYNTSFNGLFMAFLFITLSIALYARVRNAGTVAIVQIAFLGLFFQYFSGGYGLGLSVLATVFFLGFWLYENFRKD